MQPPLREAEAGALTPAPARPRCRSGWSLERLLPARNGGARPAIPSAEDLPDEPEAPPNTTDPLGNPIDPEPPSPPETPPTGNPAGPAPNATLWSLFPATVQGSCLFPTTILRNLVFHDNGSVPGGSWTYSVDNSSQAHLVFNLNEIRYRFVLSVDPSIPYQASGTIVSWRSTQPDLSCVGTGGTWERSRRYAGPG